MTEPAQEIVEPIVATDLDEAGADAAEDVSLSAIAVEQRKLREDFERLAAAVTPLLAKQYQDTQARVRALETRIRSRQERPLLAVLAGLMTDVQRLTEADDLRDHVVDTARNALTGFGYQIFGAVGDAYDPAWHEALGGDAGDAPTVCAVHSQGLACYGDVLVKAKVEVAPAGSVTTQSGDAAS